MKNNFVEELYEYSFILKGKELILENKINSFSLLLEKSQKLLNDMSVEFKYQKINAKKLGSANIKINLKTLEVKKTLFIKNTKNELLMMNVFIHELAHFILDHNDLEERVEKIKDENFTSRRTKLTGKMKEFIVDTIAEIFIYKITGKDLNDYPSLSIDDFNNTKFYRLNYIINSKINKKQFDLCKIQIETCLLILKQKIL